MAVAVALMARNTHFLAMVVCDQRPLDRPPLRPDGLTSDQIQFTVALNSSIARRIAARACFRSLALSYAIPSKNHARQSSGADQQAPCDAATRYPQPPDRHGPARPWSPCRGELRRLGQRARQPSAFHAKANFTNHREESERRNGEDAQPKQRRHDVAAT